MQKGRDSAATSLPILGRTWQKRGPGYWLRRFVYTLLMGVAVFIETAIIAGIYSAIPSHTGKVIFVILQVVFSLITGAILFRSLQRKGQSITTTKQLARAGTAGVAVGFLARAGSILSGVFLVVGGVLTYGVVLTIFIRSFLPRLDIERPVLKKSRQTK